MVCLQDLWWVDDDCTQSDILDHYFDLLEHELIVNASTTLGEVATRLHLKPIDVNNCAFLSSIEYVTRFIDKSDAQSLIG